MTDVILEADKVRFCYPGAGEALCGVSFSVRTGTKTALLGANGAGKSTLLLMLNGMIHPSSGEIRFHGRPLAYSRGELRELRRRVGFVYQDPDRQILAPTVWQDVAFGPVNLDYDDTKIRRVVKEALGQVGLAGFDRRAPHHLSGGEKKRVAIAGVLAMDPDILVLDEPTSSLDPAGAADVMELLDELNAQGKTIIISTHDVELSHQWADDVILMSKGTVVSQGSPQDIFTRPELITTTNLRAPAIIEIYTELFARKMLTGTRVPKSILQLVKCFEYSARHEKHPRDYGTITVCNIDEIYPSAIHVWLTGHPSYRRGAMGTRAKDLAGQESIALDFAYGVIDKCILRALIGESSLILTIKEMVPRIERRVAEYCAESGNAIPVIPLVVSDQPRTASTGTDPVK
ncbi:MAG: ATP-binding cassette domain-containing protein [Methanoregula sp.]|nr:ATP-binding cassette domain-containing protein [Methanoregula sp.]